MDRKLKDFIKALTPPILINAQRRIRGRQPLRFFWRGVYRSFGEVPAKGRGFRNTIWLESARTTAEQWLKMSRRERKLCRDIPLVHSLLPMLAALKLQEGKTFRILDFGGGMGVGYIAMVGCLAEHQAIEYHIVDNAETCEIGEALFRSEAQLHFHSVVPTDLRDVSVVYFSTSLQYVEDYPGLLRQLAGLRPKFFLFVKLQAGDNPTYVSGQLNFEDQSIVPCWFFNMEELLILMRSLHYELVFRSTTDRTYDMSNFESRYQVSRYCNLVFINRPGKDQSL
jgi:putative methyltransferase (TIGR04325 family)